MGGDALVGLLADQGFEVVATYASPVGKTLTEAAPQAQG